MLNATASICDSVDGLPEPKSAFCSLRRIGWATPRGVSNASTVVSLSRPGSSPCH